MKRLFNLVLFATAIAAPAFAEPPPADGSGTTIVGERETAVGLYLLPWQEEAPSDIDRPPAHFEMPAQAPDGERLRALSAADEAGAAYRRVRTEPR
ncbi:hypothetical protein [Solimonas variicoloris]|uniref:hypothetical protein n=1 Tax=Solimonas variicoloris TaxID=254408 RepID=UPI000361372A|nr:hypothetical protein [Solimonas variicoloris]